MTDNEIIKALEEMVEYPHYYEEGQILKNVLDLINRQKAEIDDLERIVGMMDNRKYYRKFVDEVYRKEVGNELSDPDFDYIYQLYFDQKAEIERLKECPKCVYEYNGEITEYCVQSPCSNYKTAEQIKAEAIKEFAQRLKNAFPEANRDNKCPAIYIDDYCYIIDECAEEMVGDNNAK